MPSAPKGERKFPHANHGSVWLLGLGTSKAPKKVIIITWEELWVIINMAGKLVQLLVNMEPLTLFWLPMLGLLTQKLLRCQGRKKVKAKTFHHSSNLHLGKDVTHKFLVKTEFFFPLLWRDILSALGTTLTLPENQNKGLFFDWTIHYRGNKQSSPKYSSRN